MKRPPIVYKVRVTGDVLETASATRQVKLDGQVLTFGREPVYIRADKLPQKLATDTYLDITIVDPPPSDVDILDLKAERVQ